MLTAGRVVALPICVFVWQALYAVRTFRPVEGERGPGLAGLISLAFVALVANSGNEPVDLTLFGIACGGFVAGLVLFEWARRTIRGQYFSWVFAADTPTFLFSAGPFAYVRNPFYTSYLLTMGATVLMLPNLFRAAVFLAMVIYFHAAALHEERKFARSALATDYERYKQSTGRFLPKLSGVRR